MKLFKTLTLFVILAVLASYVYFYEIKGGEDREKQKALEEKVLNFEKDSVRAIEIRSIMNQFRFERTAEGWDIVKPVQTGGEKSTIDGLLNTLSNIKKVREFKIKKEELLDYGLVGRSTLATIIFNDGTRDSVRFGDETPVGNNIFANSMDSLVFMIAAYTKSTATKQLFDWRDKSVALIKKEDVKEFRLRNKHGEFYIIREAPDWRLTAPLDTRADLSAVNMILNKLNTGKVKSVISESLDNPRDYSLEKPAYKIDLYLGEGKAHKQIIFSELKENISSGKDDSRPHVFTVDSLFLKDLNKNLFQLRYKKFAEFDNVNADSVVVTQGDSTFYVVKDTADAWVLEGKKTLKRWKMVSYVNAVDGLQSKKFLLENVSSTRRFGMDNPERRIVIFKGGNKIQEVYLSSFGEDKKVAFCPATKIVAEITKNTYDNLEFKQKDFVEAEESNEDIS